MTNQTLQKIKIFLKFEIILDFLNDKHFRDDEVDFFWWQELLI